MLNYMILALVLPMMAMLGSLIYIGWIRKY